MNAVIKPKAEPKLLRLDLGCGNNKREGFYGVDERKFDAVDKVVDLRKKWPWKDQSVDEVHCSHFVEHLDAAGRIHFVNELYRVLKKGAKATIITPHWCSSRAYGDLTHQWPPVSEFWFQYLNAEWRSKNAPHNDFYKCDFDSVGGYSLHPGLAGRNQDYTHHAISFWKEAAQDTLTTLTRR